MKNILIYGCYGYTGRLIVEWGQEKGLPMVLSGRNAAKVQAMGQEFNLPVAPAALDDDAALADALGQCVAVVHCAGPFAQTYQQMAAACLHHGVHYLDITGEIEVFEGLAALDAEAQGHTVMLLPGVGFDVVPTDCMGAYLHRQLPDATALDLAFRSVGGGLSHGTASTVVQGMGEGSLLRRNGQIVSVPAAKHTIQADFGRGAVEAVGIPWGDVSTAYHTTGIPNVTTYTAVSPGAKRFMRWSNSLGWLLRSGWVRRLAQRRVDKAAPGPSADARAKGVSLIWGRVRNLAGDTRTARLKTLNGYTLTARGAVYLAQAVLDGQWEAGFQTPAGLHGPELIQKLDPEVSFVDLEG